MMKRTVLALSTACLLTAAGCGEDSVPGQCNLDFDGSDNADFGDPGIDGLLEATGQFSVTATELETSVRDACNNIASDLGGSTDDDTATACANAVAEIDGTFEANADVTFTLEYVAPVCSADVSVIADCAAECDVNFDASATPPTCEGGELSGECSGMCQGECSIEGDASCSGSCDGSCTGTCDATVVASCTGTCMGQCDGTCSSMDGDGNCNGSCDGTCRGMCSGSVEGSCSGTCEGSCSASCRAEVDGSCSGSCSGSCDVDFVEPSCEGGELDVMADADCKASCEAEASFAVECTEPTVIISYSGSATVSADVDALVDTLEANFGTILAAIERLDTIASATVSLATQLTGAATAAANLGLEAADCVRLAVDAQVAAAASIMVSVEASASVSGSVAGGTN